MSDSSLVLIEVKPKILPRANCKIFGLNKKLMHHIYLLQAGAHLKRYKLCFFFFFDRTFYQQLLRMLCNGRAKEDYFKNPVQGRGKLNQTNLSLVKGR